MKSPTYITTSWDDGHPTDLRVAALLAKYGIAGTFYVPATARQRQAYLLPMKTMKNGHVVDAARPLEHVVRNVNDIILRHLTMRTARRFDLEPMPMPNLLARIFFRIVRDIKSKFGVESYLKNEDRRVLEQIIFPYFLHEDSYEEILFVGCHWYTKGYNERFETKKKSYWTIEIDPSRAKYGAKQHIVDGLQYLSKHFKPGALDLILCNGVFGWGLAKKTDVEQAFRACCDCLREGGVLVVGWDDIEERRPFLLEECQSLRALKPFFFPPLGAAEYLTDTPYRHTYTFCIKQ
jgi:SAM-dependent methyltransferase